MVIGSGAGGGTLGTELAQKRNRMVILEAGGRYEIEEFVNDEWASFTQLAWLDKRTTSGGWRVAKRFPELAGLDRQGGRRFDDPLGRRLASLPGARVQGAHRLRRYAGRQSHGLADQLKDLEPYYAKAEDRDGRYPDNGIPGLPGNNNYKVLEEGAKALGYKESAPATWRSTRRARRAARMSADRVLLPGLQVGAKWSTLYAEIPKGEETGKLEVRPNSHVVQIEHDAAGKVTGVVYADKDGNLQRQKARIVAVAGNSIESPRLLLNSASSKFPDGLANSSGQVGRNYMRHMTGSVYAVFDKPVRMCRGTTMAGIVQDEAGHDPVARLCGRVRAGDAVARAAFHGSLPRSRRVGPRASRRRSTPTRIWPGMWIVGEDMPQAANRITLHAA